MAATFIPGWILVTIAGKQGNEVYHYNVSYKNLSPGTPTSSQLLQTATDIYNRFTGGLVNISPTSLVWPSCSARDMSSAFGEEQVYVPASPASGSVAADSEPASLCGVISEVPSAVGKGVRGRMFISPLPETMIVSQVLSSLVVSALTSVAASLRSYAGPSGLTLIAAIASRKHALLRPWLSSVVSNQVNNQVRRLIGHRRHKRRVGP